MKHTRMPTAFCRYSRMIGLVIVAALGCQSLLPAAKAQGLGADILYVGDASDDTVKSFNADTGAANGAFISLTPLRARITNAFNGRNVTWMPNGLETQEGE
jgi:hypothetical protein